LPKASTNVNIDDVRFAAELGYTLKLLAIAKRRQPGADPEEVPGGVELRVHTNADSEHASASPMCAMFTTPCSCAAMRRAK
jgi:hypothetical protein